MVQKDSLLASSWNLQGLAAKFLDAFLQDLYCRLAWGVLMFQEFNFSKDLDALDFDTNDGHRVFL